MRSICFVLGLVVLSMIISAGSANGEVFKLGDFDTKSSTYEAYENDYHIFSYSEGYSIVAHKSHMESISLMLDGNLSTGINITNPGGDRIKFQLIFHTPVNISTISVDPTFDGGAALYIVGVGSYDWGLKGDDTEQYGQERTYYINGTVTHLDFSIFNNYAWDRVWFNDFIINYTIPSSTNKGLIESINSLSNRVTELEKMNENLTGQIHSQEEQLEQNQVQIGEMNETLADMNNTSGDNTNESELENRVFTLESENRVLDSKIENISSDQDSGEVDYQDISFENPAILLLLFIFVLIAASVIIITQFFYLRAMRSQFDDLKSTHNHHTPTIPKPTSSVVVKSLVKSPSKPIGTGASKEDLSFVPEQRILENERDRKVLPAASGTFTRRTIKNSQRMKGEFVDYLNSTEGSPDGKDSEVLLQDKYERGEISEEMYEYIKKDIDEFKRSGSS